MSGTYWFRMVNGEDLDRTVTYFQEDGTPVDLTGYTAVFSIGKPALISVSTTETDDGVITLGGTDGTIGIFIKRDSLSALSFVTEGYRLMLTDPSNLVSCLLFGQFSKEDG